MGKGKTRQHSCLSLRPIKCDCVFFFCFPFFVLFCLIHPIAIVFEVISFCVLCFFSPHKVVDVVFPSFLWSSDWSSCSDFVVRTRMPIKNLTCPFLSFSTSSFCVSLSSKVSAFFHVFFGVFSTSFDDLNPFLFFFTFVIFFITVFLDRKKNHCLDLCLSSVRSPLQFLRRSRNESHFLLVFPFFLLTSLLFPFVLQLVSSCRLDDEAKHLPLCGLDHAFMCLRSTSHLRVSSLA